MNWKPVLGLIILAAVGGVVYWLQEGSPNAPGPGGDPGARADGPATVVSGFVGGEKSRFLANPEVQEILRGRYAIELDAVKAGSIEMVTRLPTEGKSFLWPSNQVAVELHRRRGGVVLAEENVFNSPIVLYTWDVVGDALREAGLVTEREGVRYLSDFPGLVERLEAGADWKSVGLDQLYGRMKVYSTDPRRSNSGNMFSGLLANMMAGGEVVTEDALPSVLPRLTTYFESMGYMEHSSGDIFESFLKTGVGAKPIIVGYENQLIEYALEHRDQIEVLERRIRTLFPVPTVWSSHPIIALDEDGRRLIEAMQDDDLQRLAWERHGFRSGLMGVENDPAALPVRGVPPTIQAVLPMPSATVMEAVLDGLGGA